MTGMKEATLEQLTQNAPRLMADAQQERILITHDGRPLAVIVGIENKDEEDWELEASPEFWGMIEERRREVGVSLEEVERHLFDEAK